nr:hypothetical protein CFP56_47320 [Quercus suber]
MALSIMHQIGAHAESELTFSLSHFLRYELNRDDWDNERSVCMEISGVESLMQGGGCDGLALGVMGVATKKLRLNTGLAMAKQYNRARTRIHESTGDSIVTASTYISKNNL